MGINLTLTIKWIKDTKFSENPQFSRSVLLSYKNDNSFICNITKYVLGLKMIHTVVKNNVTLF